ncbi:MAG: hypothetical protein KBC90_11415 [Spirochaetes bacterium]|nr:hypothetical protein [Spirochaetota bacterium]
MVLGILALIIAYKGLMTWRKQLLGQNKYELSLNVIKSLRILIDEIERFRHPMYFAGELYAAYKEAEQKELDSLDSAEIDKANIHARNIRWNKVFLDYTDYDSKMLHLKIILDDYQVDKIGDETMTTLITKLRNSIIDHDHYNRMLRPELHIPQEKRLEYIDLLDKNYKILSKSSPDNEYSKTLEDYFTIVKDRLKKHLK